MLNYCEVFIPHFHLKEYATGIGNYPKIINNIFVVILRAIKSLLLTYSNQIIISEQVCKCEHKINMVTL